MGPNSDVYKLFLIHAVQKDILSRSAFSDILYRLASYDEKRAAVPIEG